MASPDDVEIASRYDGIGVGPRLAYSFETQTGIPIDGTNAQARKQSPFTLRILPSDALLEAAAGVTQTAVGTDVGVTDSDRASGVLAAQAAASGLITAAAQAADGNSLAEEVATALARVSAIGTDETTLETFVSSGQFLADQNASYFATLSDAYTAADIALQLKRILEAPPLTLLVSPNSMTISYSNMQTYVSRTRFGFLFERWGEDQPTISFSGSTGAFIAGAADAPGTDTFASQLNLETSSPSGLQFASKRDSAAWQNLVALLHFYKNNGYIYDTVGGTEAHLMVGAIAIDYDQWTYVGHIENFDYSYSADTPHRVEWSMEFKVDRMYDWGESTMVVLPQTAPTDSPSNVGTGGTPGGTPGNALAGASAAVESATDRDSRFGVIPFELLR